MKTMKKTMFSVLMIVLAIAITACSKDDDGGSATAEEGTIRAKVDGNTITTLKMTTFANKSTQSGITTLTMQGNTGGTTSEAFVLGIMGFDGEGSYDIGGGANISAYASYTETTIDLSNPSDVDVNVWGAPYDSSVAGQIVFTEATDERVVGTFHFTAQNEDDESIKTISEGAFNISVTNY